MVAYNPDLIRFISCINSIIDQIDCLIIVDNSDAEISFLPLNSKIIHIRCSQNVGIARAQNIGIVQAINMGAEYFLLSDQDTIFPAGYIVSMLNILNSNDAICSVVPRIEDDRIPDSGAFIKIRKFGLKWRVKIHNNMVERVVEAPASGMLIKLKHLKLVGFMREDLFIDLVDLEWCWRANKRNLMVIANGSIVINHRFGDSAKKYAGKILNSRSPIRSYYIARNTLYLAIFSKDISVVDRMGLLVDCLKYLFGFSLFFSPHYSHLKCCITGFHHAITSRLGKIQNLS